MILPDELRRARKEIPLDGLALDFPISIEGLLIRTATQRKARRLAQLGLSPDVIFTRLIYTEIRELAEALLPAYEHSNGRRGLLSVPLLPLIGSDSSKLFQTAETLWQVINRPNLILSFPCTPSGLQAFRGCLDQGLNAEIRSILTLEEYNQVRNLHRNALDRLTKRGQATSHIIAQAAIDLSLIDSVVNRELLRMAEADESRTERSEWLQNRAGLAVADLVMAQQEINIRAGERQPEYESGLIVRWEGMHPGDATLAPSYYLEQLAGFDSIATIDHEFLTVFSEFDRSMEARRTDISVSRAQMEAIENLGVDVQTVLCEARESRDRISLEKQRDVFEGLSTWADQCITEMGDLLSSLRESLMDLQNNHINHRIWESEQANNRENPNWLGMPQSALTQRRELGDLIHKTFGTGDYDALLIVGAFGKTFPLELLSAVSTEPAEMEVRILNHLDPIRMRKSIKGLQPERTLSLILDWEDDQSEALGLLTYLWSWSSSHATIQPGDHFCAIARAGSTLAELATQRNFRLVHFYEDSSNDSYGSLGLEVLLPAMIAGLDLETILVSSREMVRSCSLATPSDEHPGLYLSAVLVALAQSGRRIITVVSDRASQPLQRWLVELLDLAGRGVSGKWAATCDEQPGRGDAYDETRGLVYLRADGELDRKCSAWIASGHPVLVYQLDPHGKDIGASMLAWQYAVTAALEQLEVDPARVRDRNSGLAVDSWLKTWERRGGFEDDDAKSGQVGFKVVGRSKIDVPDDPSLSLLWRSVMEAADSTGGIRLNFFLHLPVGVRRKVARIQTILRDHRGCWSAIEDGRIRPRMRSNAGFNPANVVLSVRDTRDLKIPDQDVSFNVVQRARARAAHRAAAESGIPALHIELESDRALKICIDSLMETVRETKDTPIPGPTD